MHVPPQFLIDFNNKWLSDKPAIVNWLQSYVAFVHNVDDLVDEEKNYEAIIDTISHGRRLFTDPVYLNFKSELDVVDELSNITYLDSVKWEKAPEQWKRLHADSLRHCGYNMFFAVIYLYCGKQALKEIHTLLREFAHLQHLHDNELVSNLKNIA